MDEHALERLLSSLYAGGGDLRAAAKRAGLSLGELSRWCASPRGRETVASLRRAAQARSDLALSRARAEAARSLAILARDRDAKETARKACVDLLRLDEPASADADADDDLSEQERSAWLAALERLGRDDPPEGSA